MTQPTPKAFVAGWPIDHSRSPLIHGYWLKHYGIEGSYERLAIAPDKFAEVFTALPARGFCGGNITLPHKIRALDFVDEVDPVAEAIGAINTVVFQDQRIFGSNTDAYGFFKNLSLSAPAWQASDGPALVLGAGGACLAVIAALLQEGTPKIYLANRSRDKAEAIKERFGKRINVIDWDERNTPMADIALLVNTTSLGMTGKPALFADIAAMPKTGVVADLVYSPLETELLASARRKGLAAADGLGMLLHQATLGFEKWFGVLPDVTPELRRHVESDLKENS